MTTRSTSLLVRLAACLVAGLFACVLAPAASAADATAPAVTFGSWSESSPWAHYDGSQDVDRLWFNPNQSGSASALTIAKDPETGVAFFRWPTPPTGWSPTGSDQAAGADTVGLIGQYWNTSNTTYSSSFVGNPTVTRIDPNVDFDWATGTPHASIPVTNFSARWTGKLVPPDNGIYYFQTSSNDGVRVQVNGTEVLRSWNDNNANTFSTQCPGGISLVAGVPVDIVVEYFENNTNTASMKLRWRIPSQAASYQVPSGTCDTTPAIRDNYANGGWSGGGTNIYPPIPSSAFTVGGGVFNRTFSWVGTPTPASGGTVNATANNNDAPQGTSADLPIEFAADSTPPVAGGSGTLDIGAIGWGTTGTNTLNFPRATNQLSDAGASSAGYTSMTRMLQRKDGVADGAGSCSTGAGTWTDIGTPVDTVNTITGGFVDVPAANTCSEYRYRITDAVGNILTLTASGYRGWDTTPPTGAVASIAEDSGNQYQIVRGTNQVYVNTNQAGAFTVTTSPTDAHAGVASITHESPGANWTPVANTNTFASPWAQQFTWTSGAANAGARRIRITDGAGNNPWMLNAFTITRDITAPTGGTFTPPNGTTWRNTLSVPFNMTVAPTETGSGIASYQLQREQAPWNGTACDPFDGVSYTNIGAPVLGDPPPLLTGVNDTSVADNTCYRYRVEVYDQVTNIGTMTNTNSVRVDDTDPTGSFNSLPAFASGSAFAIGGTAADTMSGVASITLRLENLDVAGPILPIYTDAAAPFWGTFNWNTTAVTGGNYRIHLDVTDVAGNTTSSADTYDVLVDNTAPTVTHTGFTEGTNPEFQHVDPVASNHRAWVKTTGIGAANPSITANFTATDTDSGIDYVTTPAAPGGGTPWTPSTATQVQDPGPYSQSYSWTAGVANFATRSATSRNNAGITSANEPFTITADNTAPGGGSVTPAPSDDPWHTSTSIDLAITSATDGGSGMQTQRVMRDELARNVAASCAGTAPWPNTYATQIGPAAATLPATITDNSLVSGMCYRYRIEATDNVGNVSNSANSTRFIVDPVAPTATIDTTPPSPFEGTINVTGTSTDGPTDGSSSGVDTVTLRWLSLDDMTTTNTVGIDTGAEPLWSISWNTTSPAIPDGNYRLFIDITDVASNQVTSIATRDVVVDNSPPVVTFNSFVEGPLPDCQHTAGGAIPTFWYSVAAVGCVAANDFAIRADATDAPGGVAFVQFPVANMNADNLTPDAPVLPNTIVGRDTTASPFYEWRYTYDATASGSPNLEYVTATGNQGLNTVAPPATPPNTPHVSVNIVRDHTGPTGHTITPPGGTASPAWWSNAATPSVAFSLASITDAASGVRAGAHVLQRQSAPGPACTAWSGFAPVGTTGLASPFADPSAPEDACYRYRLIAYDNVSNASTVPSTNQVRIDRTLPTGTINPVAPYVKGNSVTLGGTSGDNWSGVASISVRFGAGPATACTPAVAATWSCSWDTTATSNGAKTLVLVVTDRAGNVLDTQTQSTYVDNELPNVSVSLATGTNPGAQHLVPGPTPRIYVNTNAGTNGTFVATATPTDGFSGVANVQFPDLLTGWTRTPVGGLVTTPGPYTLTYAWTGSATTADPGGTTVQVADNTANLNTAPFEVVADTTPPSAVTLDYADGPTTTPSIDFTPGTESTGSGMRTWRIERQEAAVTGPNTCSATWSSFTPQVTDPLVSPWQDGSASLNMCYRYQIVSIDNVGNETTVADATGDTVSIEPAGVVVLESAASTSVTEGGATDTYTVRLRTRPSDDVVVTLGSDAQVDTNVPTLTFTDLNWNVAQTVTVTAVQDPDDEVPDPHAGTITHVAASSDGDYDTLTGADVVASITDDDTSSFIVSADQSSVAVLEAGATSDTYTIRLASRPTADVVVTLGNTDDEVAFAPATLTFTNANWNTNQTVTITALDDDYDEAPNAHPGVVTHAVASSDTLYAAQSIADTTAVVTDDDAAGVTISPTGGLLVAEGNPATDQYSVVLDSEPVGSVTITLSITDAADVAADVSSLTFTSADWDTPKLVTVSSIDDLIVEGPETHLISHVIGAPNPADSTYLSAAAGPISVDVDDDDIPDIEVTPTTGLTATEGGAGASYQVRLATEPTANVTIAFAAGTQIDPITSLVFTPGNWNTYQDVDATATQDDIDEVPDPHTGTIVHTVTSGDTTYDGWILANQSVAITDDDQAGVDIDDGGGVDLDEANVLATDTISVVLESEPVGTVTVTPAPDAQVTTSGAVTFDDTDWNIAKNITITAVDDSIDEAAIHPGAITFDVTGGDPLYAAINPAQVDADVADDDTAAIIVSSGALVLDEDLPASDSFTVRLDSEPTSPVTVTIGSDTQSSASAATLTFNAGNWSADQTVTVAAIDDPVVEDDPHPSSTTIQATAGDPGYLGLPIQTKAATIADNDLPGVTVSDGGGVAVTEGTGTDSYTVVLARQPQADVVVTVGADSQVQGMPTVLTFTPATWNVAQVVTVTAVDDAIDEGTGTHPGAFTHTVASSDPRWSTVTSAAGITAAVTDDDAAGVTVTATSPYALSEDTPAPGTTVTYSVVLDSEPTSDVDVDLTVPGDLDASPTTLTFTAADWDTAQTVTVGAIDDAITEALVHTRTITHAVTSGDTLYAGTGAANVAFDVADNDIPGITVSETSLTATEGGATDTFTVVLDTQPTADVVVDLTGTQVGFDIDPLTFTPLDWNTPQAVVVTATDDDVDEHPDTHPGLVELDATSTDPVYAGWPLADITVAITDDDTAGVTITPGSTAIAVDEASPAAATYDVVLDTRPTGTVTITPTTADGQTLVTPGTLTFDALDWNVAKQFSVTAVDDPIDETNVHPGVITHAASGADPHYGATLAIDDQAVDVSDDDTSGVTVTPTSGLALDEAAVGTTASFTVVLDSQPAGNVVIDLATLDGQTSVAPAPLTFAPGTWNAAQTVTVTVVDDQVDENGPHPGLIELDATAPADAAYDAVDPADVTATIADDDTAGVIITESAGSTDVDEGSTTDTYLVRLATQPTADVDIDLTGGLDATTVPVQLTFTTANWAADQVVTVHGTPDWVIEGNHDQVITHVASGEPNYDGTLAIADVVAHVTDDDAAGATITPTNVAITEDGVTATYDVVLDAEPTADVTIALTPDAEVLVSVPSLVFTSANWNAVQSVTVTANDDFVVEPSPHAGVITHAMSSPDADFNVAVADVTAAIDDNDVPGVTVTPTTALVTEGAGGASFDVVLDSKPTADVTITFTEGGQLDPIADVTFTPLDWNVAQPVAIDAFDDYIAEGTHATTISLDTASTDTYYAPGTLTISDVAVDIADNDTAGVLVVPSSGLAGTEGGAPVSYDISLTSQPLGPVTITLSDDADGTVTPATLTFDAIDWATPKPVDVAIVDDAIAEGTHDTTVTHDVSSALDPLYDTAVTAAPQVVSIADDDTAGVTFTPVLPGPLAIGEAGPDATYSVVLTSEPTGPVTIDVASLAGQATAAPATLTFTSATWSAPQDVTVTADDDQVAEPSPHADSLTHTAGGSDTTYAGLTLGDMDLAITDDDVPGVLIDATLPDTSVEEGALGDTVRVSLATEPTDDVTITLTGSQVTLTPATLTFTSADWNTPQDVAVDAIDDDIFEGPHAGTIDALSGSVGDPFYAGVAATQHPVAIDDDDTAGVIVTQAAPDTLDELTPLASRTYAVRLESEPVQPVDVLVAPDPQVASATTSLTFTPANWDTDQTVAVTPIDDAVAEASPHPGAVAHDTTSLDPSYATGTLTIDDATFAISDDDTPGVLVTPTSPHAVAEGAATSTYDIVLESQPTDDVTFAPVSTQLEWSVPSITFTTANWSTPQSVTLRAVDDTLDEADPHTGTVVHAITTLDLNYQGVAVADVSADITDNDTSDLVATPVGTLSVDEAGTLPAAQYVLTLTSTPTADVTVALATAAPAQLAFTPATVTLTAANWNTGVTVDVTAVQDQVDETDPHLATITHAMSSPDTNFGGEAGPSQDVDVLDDDTAGVTVTETSGATVVHEDGSIVDDYDVVLDTQPTADVTITLATPGSQVAVSPATLTFTTTNWNTPQPVDVTAVDDSIFEGPHPGTITHVASSTDPNYDPTATAIVDVVANVLDDDVPGITVTPVGGTFEVAEGTSDDQLVVTLDTEPTSAVTIDLATPDLETTVTPAQVVLDAANWNTGVTVDVAAVDDGFIEGPHTGDVEFAVDASASDDAYDTVVEPNATAQISDNDSATVVIDEGDGLALDEAAPATTDTLTIKLGASPDVGESVDVDLTELAPGGQVTFSPATVSFDDATWDTPQTVTVTVVDDDIDEATPHSTSIQYASTSPVDLDFDNLVIADTNVTITDDDTAGISITPPTIAIAEAGTTTQSVDVQLLSEPTGPVEIAVTGDAQAEVVGGPVTLAFTPGDWDTPQAVTIRAIDDQDHEDDPHPATITFDASSPGAADPTYDALADETRLADVADDDVSEVLLTVTAGTQVDEAAPGSTVDYDVALATRPSGDVTIALVPDAQLEVVGGPVTLTFTQANWSTAQPIQVRAADDPIVEGSPHPGLLAVDVGGADPRYDALTPTAASVDVADDDTAGVTVTQVGAPGQLEEDGSLPDATYDVQLTSQPIADVEVTITPDAQVAVVGGDTTLTFTPADWSTPQPVSISAVDDLVTEVQQHPAVVTHSSDSPGDANYAAAAALTIADATFEIGDDDQPGFTLTPAAPALAVDEAGATSQTYQLAIDSIPAGDVVVDVATASADVTVTPATLTFNGANAATPQDITVTAIDDTLVDPAETATITHAVNTGASHAGYTTPAAPTIADATVAVTDDDTAGVIVDPLDGIAVAEPATTDTYEVRLQAQPGDDVTVSFAANPAQLEPITDLTFTPATWSAPQIVTVQARDDLLVEADPHVVPVTTTTTSLDTAFDGLAVAPTDVSVDDDDVPDILVTDPADMTMTEDDIPGSVRTFTVRLATQPTTPVTIVAGNDGQTSFLSSPVLVLNAGNFSTGVQLQVQPIQEGVDELDPHPGEVTFTVQPTSDAAYASLTVAPRAFQITDSAADVATAACIDGTDWDDTSGRAQLAEDPSAATHDIACRVQLGSAPALGHDVTVDIAVAPNSQLTADRASVTFTNADGVGASQVVTFTATDDAVAEGTHPATITFDVTSTDPTYDLLTIGAVDLDITDNDTVGSVVAPAGPIAVTEGGGTETASIVLSSQPTGPVTVTIDGGSQLSTSPATLTFQPTSWNVPQDFSINATDDPIDEPDGHAGQVTFTLASSDGQYAAHVPTPLDATITDNDTPGVVVTPTDGGNAVSEAGGTDTMSARLGTRPTDDVTVTVDAGAQLTSTPATLTFTATNWDTPQALTIGAVQDTKIEGEHTGTLAFALASNDATYAAGTATTPASQPVTITDDDVAGVVIVETDTKTSVAEAGSTDTYTLALTGEPTADVTIATNGGTQVTTEPATLTFTPGTWNTPQTVKVSAVQDSIDETDPHSGEIQHSATTTAAGWTGAALLGVVPTIADDDAANIVVKQTADSTRVLEGNSRGDVVTFALSSQPTQDVTIVATGDTQVSVPTKPVVLTPAKWKDAVELQVTAVDDDEVEGDHEGTITFKVSTDDASYKKSTIAAVTVEVGDNDSDPALPTTDQEEDEDAGTRTPRSTVPPAVVRPPGSDDDEDSTGRRTSDGSTRTDEGSERTREGAEGATGTAGDDEGVRTGRQLGGEIVAATEEEVATRKGPMARALEWLRSNWILAALIVGGGTLLAGTGAWMLRGDPIKAAQRAAAAKTAADVARRGARPHPNPRLRKRKGKKDDEDEDDPKGRRTPPKRR